MKHLIFDFDGTLVDSMPAYSSVMLRLLDEYGVKHPENVIKIITPLGYNGTIDYFIKLGHPLSKEQLGEKMKEYLIGEYTYNVPAKSNVESTLLSLKSKGYGLHVLTASPHVSLDPCLKRLNLFNIFDNVWSCDDFATTKADPNIYIEAAKRIGTSIKEVLFLDDNINADKAAKQAGLATCGVYDDTSKDMVDQMKEANDYYIFDFSELLQLNV